MGRAKPGDGRARLEAVGFFVCERDLEDEPVRALGVRRDRGGARGAREPDGVRTYQKQPAHRTRSSADQLRGFLNNWKVELAAPLVEALNPARLAHPLDAVVACV